MDWIGHVRYINILTWLWGFQVKPLYLMLFSLYLSLFWESRDKGNLKNLQFRPKSLGAMLEYWYIERGLLRYQWTPKLTILPNFSHWYCQVRLIEFFQLQKVLRKMVSFRQSYNEKTILWIHYLYLEAVKKLSWSIKVPLKVM